MENKYTLFVKEYTSFLEHLPEEVKDTVIYDWVTDFCEKHDLIEDLLQCRFNVTGLYAWCKYKSEKKTLKWLKKVITSIVNK